MTKQMVVVLWVGKRTMKSIVEQVVAKIGGRVIDLSHLKAQDVVQEALANQATHIITTNPAALIPAEFKQNYTDNRQMYYFYDLGLQVLEDICHSECTMNVHWDGKPTSYLPLCCNDKPWIFEALEKSLLETPPYVSHAYGEGGDRVLVSDEGVRQRYDEALQRALLALPQQYAERAAEHIRHLDGIRRVRSHYGLGS